MTITVDHRSHRTSRPSAASLKRVLVLGYGVAVYALFLATLLYQYRHYRARVAMLLPGIF
jgi:hypothetical protein